MNNIGTKTIFTIGHSTRNFSDFLELLQSFEIELLVDVRMFPGSRKFPWFDKENLSESLPEEGIGYMHMKDLGGRRKVNKDSKNNRWKNESFRAYADYMETAEFQNAIEKLTNVALNQRTAYMCSEDVWWRCHRSMISDYLKATDWKVMHIMDKNIMKEHPYTSAARVVAGKVLYFDDDLFNSS